MDPDLIDRLREDLLSADYRAESVRAALGAAADEARERGIFTAARSALAARAAGPLGSLIRLFLLGETLEHGALGEALPALGVRGALELGLVEESEGGVRAAISLNPVEVPALSTGDQEGPGLSDWWILSDLDDQLRRGPARSDHVMGVGGATRSLLAQAVAHGESALDLGTGCGIVALALARAGIPRVVATDVSRRALGFARANARLAGLDDRIEFRLGDLFEPLRGSGGVERFDLILSNPPFVITPREEAAVRQYDYRDGGMVGDDLARTVVSRAPEHLNPGGILLCLANWESRWGESGRDRVRAWLEECAMGPLSAWVIERDLVDPARYAETWARDGGARPGEPEFESLLQAWLRDFAERRVVAIGLGSIRVRRSGERDVIRVEHVAGAFSTSPGAGFSAAFDAGVDASLMSEEEVLAHRWLRALSVAEVREHEPGQEAPRSIVLRTDSPVERAIAVDPLLAAAVGACDGELELGRIAGALATIFEVDEAEVARALVDDVRELAWLGMLAPAAR